MDFPKLATACQDDWYDKIYVSNAPESTCRWFIGGRSTGTHRSLANLHLDRWSIEGSAMFSGKSAIKMIGGHSLSSWELPLCMRGALSIVIPDSRTFACVCTNILRSAKAGCQTQPREKHIFFYTDKANICAASINLQLCCKTLGNLSNFHFKSNLWFGCAFIIRQRRVASLLRHNEIAAKKGHKKRTEEKNGKNGILKKHRPTHLGMLAHFRADQIHTSSNTIVKLLHFSNLFTNFASAHYLNVRHHLIFLCMVARFTFFS